jgi:hypothetical protein
MKGGMECKMTGLDAAIIPGVLTWAMIKKLSMGRAKLPKTVPD